LRWTNFFSWKRERRKKKKKKKKKNEPGRNERKETEKRLLYLIEGFFYHGLKIGL